RTASTSTSASCWSSALARPRPWSNTPTTPWPRPRRSTSCRCGRTCRRRRANFRAVPSMERSVPSDQLCGPGWDADAGGQNPVTYALDPAHTNVIASWNHLSFPNPAMHFGDAEGTLVYDAEDAGASSVTVPLPMAGLDGFPDAFNQHVQR